MTTSGDIVNQALQIIGDNMPPVTGNAPTFDSSPAGQAAAQLYAPCVATVMRQFEWDFSRKTVSLVVTGNVAPYPWAYEYGYPGNGIEVWQVMPTAGADPNDPVPVNFIVANAVVGTAQLRVIHTNLSPAQAVYNNNPSEATWDDGFREAVVRLLASELAMAISGKPDFSQVMLESGSAFESVAAQRRN